MDLNFLKQQLNKGTISKDHITVIRRYGDVGRYILAYRGRFLVFETPTTHPPILK